MIDENFKQINEYNIVFKDYVYLFNEKVNLIKKLEGNLNSDELLKIYENY